MKPGNGLICTVVLFWGLAVNANAQSSPEASRAKAADSLGDSMAAIHELVPLEVRGIHLMTAEELHQQMKDAMKKNIAFYHFEQQRALAVNQWVARTDRCDNLEQYLFTPLDEVYRGALGVDLATWNKISITPPLVHLLYMVDNLTWRGRIIDCNDTALFTNASKIILQQLLTYPDFYKAKAK